MGVSVAGPRFRPTSRPSRMFCDHRARNRHSDNEKFCNDLNRPKTPKMSEWPLKTLQDFPTSKLNTRVRFPSPAPKRFQWLRALPDKIDHIQNWSGMQRIR